jgi:hypothetical protein
MVVLDKKNLAIWITDKPFTKTSGVWSFFDTREDFDWGLSNLKFKYKNKEIVSIEKVKKLYKEYRDVGDEDNE